MECIVLIIALIILIILYKLINKSDVDTTISFRETFNLTDMPIVTFFAGKNKLNFIIDTGASNSHISNKASKLVEGNKESVEVKLISASCTENTTCEQINAVLTYNDKNFNVKLFINKSLDASFEDLKKNQGILLHGILGTDFLNEYSYIIDFEKYLAYTKKK